MKVCWTPKAKHTYFTVIEHLEKAWAKNEIQNFINELDHMLEQIKQNTLYFRVKQRKQELHLLVF